MLYVSLTPGDLRSCTLTNQTSCIISSSWMLMQQPHLHRSSQVLLKHVCMSLQHLNKSKWHISNVCGIKWIFTEKPTQAQRIITDINNSKGNHTVVLRVWSGINTAWELLEMQILRSNYRPTRAESLGVRATKLCFNKLDGGFWHT